MLLSLLAGCAEQFERESVDASLPPSDDGARAPQDAPRAEVVDVASIDAPVATTDAPTGRDAPAPIDLPVVIDRVVVDAPTTRSDIVDVSATIDAPPRDVVDVVAAQDVLRDTGVRVDAPAAGGCVSGAVGTRVARARWTGSGTRASVSYEANTLPDRSRWRVGAFSRSIGYTPVFGDPFLGEGGLDMSGTVFMDIELSTAGLSSVRSVTLAIYGRSYSTGSSGSFSWMTFDGSGAAPSGSVANSAPYRWYRADATAAFRAGNSGVLLRISPGPPSGSLVVNRVELCFDAD